MFYSEQNVSNGLLCLLISFLLETWKIPHVPSKTIVTHYDSNDEDANSSGKNHSEMIDFDGR